MNEPTYVPWDVHQEFEKRIESENKRQDARLGELEATVKDIARLTISVEKMAVTMGSMAEEQKRQGERLKEIEEKPAKRWDTVISGIISGIIGILLGLVSAGFIK